MGLNINLTDNKWEEAIMRKKPVIAMFLSIVIVLFLISYMFSLALADNSGNELRDGAAKPQAVFLAFVSAVKRGDIGTAKGLVYSKGRVLWDRSPRKMLAMSKNTIPDNPVLQSTRDKKEYQYHYSILSYRGVSPSTKRQVIGEVWMIVENGEWKVYNMVWK